MRCICALHKLSGGSVGISYFRVGLRWTLTFGILMQASVALAPADIPGASGDNQSTSNSVPDPEIAFERWNLYYQATSIGNYHGTFYSPYEGPLSLRDYPERDVSLTTTLFLAVRLERNTVLVFNPEIAGGRGFSGVNGLANPPNGELPRVATATPKL